MNVSSSIGSVIPTALESLSSSAISDRLKASEQENAGKQFEGIFFSMLLKEMRKSLDADGEGGLFPGEKSDTLGGMFDMYMSEHLSQSSSLGIAQAVNSYLTNQKDGGDNKEKEGASTPEKAVPGS